MRRLLPLLAVIAGLAALPALLVPAAAGQLAGMLGLSGTAEPGAPTALTPYPVLGGIGLSWAPPAGDPPASYEVERRRPSGNWAGESGRLDAGTTRWVDHNVQPDATAEYRVVAIHGDGATMPSDPVTAHRIATDPAVGDIDVLRIDADRGGAVTWLTDEIAKPVTAARLADGARTLTAGTLRFTLPGILPGPGTHTVDPTSGRTLKVQQKDAACSLTGTLTIDEIAYTPDLGLATLAARFAGSCEGANSVAGEIRFQSTKPYAAISIAPSVDFGRIVGTLGYTTKTIAVENTGMTPVNVSPQPLGGDPAWSADGDCGIVQPGATCSISMTLNPQYARDYLTILSVVTDTPVRFVHHIRYTARVVTSPSRPVATKRMTLNSVDLSWAAPFDGNSPITGYVVRRISSAGDATFNVPASPLRWSEPRLPGASYRVSAVNDVSEGPESDWATDRSGGPGQLTVFSRTGDEPAALKALAYPGGTQLIKEPGEVSGMRTEVTSSPDGLDLAYTVANGDDQELWISGPDASKTHLWTAHDIHDPVWSPDRTRIAFTTSDGATPCVDVLRLADRSVTRVGCNLSFPAWHPDAQSLLVRDGRTAGASLSRVRAAANGTRLSVLAGSNGATNTTVSATGSFVAFVLHGTQDRIGILPIGGGTPSLSDPQSPVAKLSWSSDGATLAVLNRGTLGDRIGYMTVNGGVFDQYTQFDLGYQAQPDEHIADIAWQRRGPVILPTPELFGPTGSISFDMSALGPNGATCHRDGGYIPDCTSPFSVSGLASGTHKLSVMGIPGSKYSAWASRSFTVDATGPVTRVLSPTFSATTAGATTVRYAGTDVSGVASYDVRYRKAPFNGAFGAISQPWTGTTATSVNMSLTPGYEYCVSVRAKDRFGTVGAWSGERCFSRATDDRSLTAATAGWTRASWSAFYLGTATHTGTYGASLSRTVQGKRFYLLATRCPTCGTVSVYLGGRYLTAVNLTAATTQRQTLIALPAQSSLYSGTVKITSRSAGKLVQIDGLAVRRT